jgi:creatinine amidohydrolase
MKETRFERLKPGELEAIVRERPLAWIPVGTLEWHGPHLPVGLDALKAHAICMRAAERAGGVVLPASYFSILGMNFPWTFKYNPLAFTHLMMSTLRRLRRNGVRVMIIVTGHYPVEQVLLLIGIAHAFMAATGAVVVAVPEFAMAPETGYWGDHAAKWETSIMMELFPELVGQKEMAGISGVRGFSLMREGIMGENPAGAASRRIGADVVETIVDNFSRLADRLLVSHDKNIARRVHRETIEGQLRHAVNLLSRLLKKF